jgi:hypothetical protein
MEQHNQPTILERQAEVLETDIGSFERIRQLKILNLFHEGHKEAAIFVVIGWTEDMEEWAAQDSTHRRRIIFETRRADFYLAAEDTEGALECLGDAADQASHEGHFDLLDIIEMKVNAVKKVSQKIFGEVV